MPQPDRKPEFKPMTDDEVMGDARIKKAQPKLRAVADAVRAAHPYQQESVDAFAGWDPDHWTFLLAAVTSDDPEARMMLESMSQLNATKLLALTNVLVRFGWATATAAQRQPKIVLAT